LVLVQERDGFDESEIFFVVAPVARASGRERQAGRITGGGVRQERDYGGTCDWRTARAAVRAALTGRSAVATLSDISVNFLIHSFRRIRMKIFFISSHGGGFADYVDVSEGTTIEQLFQQKLPYGKPHAFMPSSDLIVI
jgi:hypothetical protein